jgi:hypothetical protein
MKADKAQMNTDGPSAPGAEANYHLYYSSKKRSLPAAIAAMALRLRAPDLRVFTSLR